MFASRDELHEPPPPPPPVEERFWPVALALMLLGSLVMLWAWWSLPLEGPVWHRTAWPTLLFTPLAVLGAMLLLAGVDRTWVRRSVQFSLIVGVILHLLVVWYLRQTQLVARTWLPAATHRPPLPPRPTTVVPHYLPPQLVPAEDRPRQDFEKPVESRAAQPSQTAVPTARDVSDTPASLPLPQPVPVPEQLRTPEPNVARRPVLNQAAPRLASQASQLSRSQAPAAPPSVDPAPLPPAVPSPPASPPTPRPTDTATRQAAAAAAPLAPPPAAPESPLQMALERPTPRATAAPSKDSPPAAGSLAALPPPARAVAPAEPNARAEPPSGPARSTASPPPTLQAATWPLARSSPPRADSPLAASAPAPDLPVRPGETLTTSAARRPEATQQTPPASAVAPQKVAPRPTGRAAAELPATAFRVEPPRALGVPPTHKPSELTASSSAAVARSSAAARPDPVTAPRGLGEVDAGDPQAPTPQSPRRTVPAQQPERFGDSSRAALLTRRTPLSPSDSPAGNPQADIPPEVSTLPASREGAVAEASAATLARPTSEHRGVTALVQPATPQSAVALQPSTFQASAANVAEGGSPRTSGPPTAQLPLPAGDVPPLLGGSSRSVSPPAVSSAESLTVPEVGPHSAVAQAESDHRLRPSGGAALSTSRSPQASPPLPVPIEAPEGPGGLGARLSPQVGLPVRPAQSDRVPIEIRTSRFARAQVGGLPAMSTTAVVPAEAYRGRLARLRGEEPGSGPGSVPPQTEEAIERGLAFLARFQRADGSWSLQGFPEEAGLVSDTAATGLAVLAFQGAGYTHREFQYQEVVRRGLEYLMRSQQPNGDLFVPLDDESNRSVWLYSHSLATLALCEAYGMTQDPALRGPAQQAIEFIVASQDPQWGGWRYTPGVGTDTSVTGWMMMALKSGELAGLAVPEATYARIARWLELAQQSPQQPHLYRYNPLAPDTPQQRHGRVASRTMTAVGLLMRLYTGWRRDNPHLAQGAAFLAQNLPAVGTSRDPQRDTYYWYYATQVMAHMGGEYWQVWHTRLHPLLIESQVRDGPLAGSWDPRGPVPDRWGPHAGRLYVTTLNLLSLEVQYRKLPLYEDTIR